MCLENFASQVVERHNKPEVELKQSGELLLRPVTISRSPKERVYVRSLSPYYLGFSRCFENAALILLLCVPIAGRRIGEFSSSEHKN